MTIFITICFFFPLFSGFQFASGAIYPLEIDLSGFERPYSSFHPPKPSKVRLQGFDLVTG